MSSASLEVGGLDRLFAPRSVAVIGASSDPAKFGGRPLAALKRWGFAGQLLAVNPGRDEVMGVPSVRSVSELPRDLDLAVIVVPAAAAVDAIEQAIGRGIGAVALMTGGFAEAGEEGRRLDARVRELIAAAGVPLLGPNCPGFINLQSGVAASSSAFAQREEMFPGPVSLIAQSGAIAGILADRAFDRGIGLGHIICTGNELALGTPQLVLWLSEQPQTRCVALYLEGFDAQLVAAIRVARGRGTHVAVIKAGRSAAGQKVIASHTAAIAGTDDAFDAACRSLGVARAQNFDDLLEIAQVLACAAARGPRLGIAGISGGMNSMLADAASEFGMTLPDLAAETMEALGEVVPSYGSVQNPVDIASAILSNPAAVGRALALMEADPGVDITVATINDHPPQLAAALAAGLIEHSAQMVGRPVVQWSAGPMSIEGIRALGKAGLAVVTEPDRCARALAAALRSARPPTRVALPTGLPPPPTEWLSESETKALLAAAGLPVPESRVITHPADAPDAVHAVGGLAVIKADCVGIVHKTEAAAVRLGVTPEIAAEVARAVLEGARAAFGPGAVRGVLVERQLQPVAELLVSVRDDPQAGSVLTVALGGTLVEVLGDVASVLAPVDDAGARQLLESLRGAPLLHGWRGAPTVDAEALAHTVAGISALGASWAPDVSILELNPVAGLADGAVILDATAEPAGDAAVLFGGVRAPCPD